MQTLAPDILAEEEEAEAVSFPVLAVRAHLT